MRKGHTCTPSSVIQLLLVITRVLDVQEPCGQCHLSWKTTFNALQKLDATITRTSKIEFTNQFLGLWVRGWAAGHCSHSAVQATLFSIMKRLLEGTNTHGMSN